MSTLVKKLEEREAKLQNDMKGLLNEDGTISAENREKFDRMTGELHGIEASMRDAKDAELEELREQVRQSENSGQHRETEDEKRARAFCEFILGGEDRVEERSSLIAGTDANGGFIVPENMHAQLIEPVRAMNPIMRMATTFNLTGSVSIELPRKATHGEVKSVGETDERTELSAPTFANDTLTAHEVYTDQRATQLFLDEVQWAEQKLMGWIYEDLASDFEKKCVDGRGDAQKEPTGLFTASDFYLKKNVKSAGSVTAADILEMYFALPPAYRAGGTFLANGATMAQLAQLTHPAASGTVPFMQFDGDVPSILGKKVEECQNAPSIGSATFPLAFGDIARAYAVAIHKTPAILRDPYTAKPKVSFYAYGRMGGRPWNPEACVLLSTATE